MDVVIEFADGKFINLLCKCYDTDDSVWKTIQHSKEVKALIREHGKIDDYNYKCIQWIRIKGYIYEDHKIPYIDKTFKVERVEKKYKWLVDLLQSFTEYNIKGKRYK